MNRNIGLWILLPPLMLLLSLLCSCSREEKNLAQGYIEGRYTYLATNVSGVLKEIAVNRGNYVKRGQLLFILDPQPESDSYRAAKENLQESIAARDAIAANLEYAKLTYERYKVLVPQKAIQQSALDDARSKMNANIAQLAQANATIAQAEAKLAESKWTTEQKVITAPVDGFVFDTYYRIGEFTLANQAILSLLAPKDIKAIFYISEPNLSSLKIGDPITVQCAGCDKPFQGKITFISPSAEYTPPVIYSEQTNYKLIYRIEAEFDPKDAIKLHPGQPISVKYQSHV